MSNSSGASALIKAALSHYTAEKDKAIAELDIYLNKGVGVGEHAKVTDEVIALFKKLDESQGVIETITEIIEGNKEKNKSENQDGTGA
jgi:hypothetical protein